MKKIKYFSLVALLISSFSFSSTFENKKNANTIEQRHHLDNRAIKTNLSPNVLNAVGKLSYKRKKNRRNKVKLNCTANLIAPDNNIGSDIILTAKHCISDETVTYKWTSSSNNNEKIERVAKLLYTDKTNDWALLKLTKAILHEDINPLIINENTFNNINFSKIDSKNYMVAGFSVDWLGDYGKTLTYEDNPSYIDFSSTDSHIGKVGALTHQGDSGGAIIYEKGSSGYLVGIMSFISPDENLFKSTKGTFGNLSGYFLDFIKYKASYAIIESYF